MPWSVRFNYVEDDADIAVYKKPFRLNRSAGSLEDIIGGVEMMASAGNQATRYEIRVRLRDETIDVQSTDELRTHLADYNLRHVRSIWIRVEGDGLSPNLDLTFRDDPQLPALEGEVAGVDRTRVEGVHSRLVKHFRRGRRWPGLQPPFIMGITIFAAILGVVRLLAVGWHVSFSVQSANGIGSAAQSANGVVAVAVLAIFATAGLAGWTAHMLFPSLELLSVGGKTRLRRFGGWGALGLLATLAAWFFPRTR